MVPKQHYAETYDAETVSELCQIAGIDPADTARVKYELEHFAAIYRWKHTSVASSTPGTPVKRELNTLANQAARLIETLATLSPEAARAIERQVDSDMQSALVNPDAPPTGPSLFIQLEGLSDDVIGHSADLELIQTVVGGLHRAARTASNTVRKGRPSKPLDLGMLIWLSNVKAFWQANTSLPFSRDVTSSGEPITNSGTFCLVAFRAIEPDCQTSRIMNGMKAVIKRGNNPAGNLRA